jgi:hypothetical protein
MCARPGCQGPAAAWLTYAYGDSQVWLDDHSDGGGDRWPLCASHAERLKVPRGWSQVDRRTGPGDGRSFAAAQAQAQAQAKEKAQLKGNAPEQDGPIIRRPPRALAS